MKNITENNKMIAEFMGGLWNESSQKYGIGNAQYLDIGTFKNLVKAKYHYSLNELSYHSDWNWLMEVVEKIESLNLGNTTIKTVFSEEDLYINSNVSFLIMYKECYVNFFGEMKVYENWISVTECNSKIEAVYTACVEFIKWYNEQK